MFSFQQILNSSPQVKQYFTLYANSSNQCMKLATELIKQSIARRKTIDNNNQTQNNNNNNTNKFIKKDINHNSTQQQKSPKQSRTNHYNVAYIKHNRFLSPSQKKQVTPKVTQIIPISPQKLFIYAKPKVKLDQFQGCQIHHQNNCFQTDHHHNQYQNSSNQHLKEHYQVMERNESNANFEKNQIAQQENYHKQHMQIPYQYEQYLQPKKNNKTNKKRNSNNNVNNNNSNKSSKLLTQQQQNKSMSAIISPKSSKQTNTSYQQQRLTSPKSYIINPTSQQNYSNVQSKIKQLINRDKRNRQVEKQVQKQKQQIQQLQQRQKRLLIQQKQQQQELLRNQLIKNQIQRQQQLQRIRNAYETAYNDQMEKYTQSNQMAKFNQSNQMAKFTQSNYNLISSAYRPQLQSSITSQSQDSIVNLHNHKLQQSRVQCYECEIQRLRKRKQKAKQAIKQIEKQQAKRNQLLIEIAQNSQNIYPQMMMNTRFNNNSNMDESYGGNSLTIY